ncbi:hypothetical protein [Streptomyces boncukensis]|uniref:Uncharacterized protein n=1 Tax=Streptomyces boncukensis TaxID=2711219 RepID=A0A6G4WVT7_9ACTN|nr:hypothetical protein [Streptomyces boncukensis]NGO69228.1 hypothetical protein [Streptomyces boncukensis]
MVQRAEGRTRRRRAWLGGALALVLAAGGLTGWAAATGTPPFDGDSGQESYCWGAWTQDSGPRVLGGDADRRTVRQSAPTTDRPRGTCTVTQRASGSAGGGEQVAYTQRVALRYGTLPRGGAERRAWLGEFLSAQAERLPDGLPGAVGADRGMVVLPKRCDVDGRPVAVTLRAHSRGSSTGGDTANPPAIGTERQVAEMLLSAANRGMDQAGCAADDQLKLTSAFPRGGEDAKRTGADRTSPVPRGVCAIPGLRGGPDSGAWSETGADDRLQVCTVTKRSAQGEEPELAGQFLAVTEPRLVALFDGMAGSTAPARGWRGKGTLGDGFAVVRASCADGEGGEGGGKRGGAPGGDAVFFQQLSEGMRKAADPSPERVFAGGVDAAAKRAGCARVTPAG